MKKRLIPSALLLAGMCLTSVACSYFGNLAAGSYKLPFSVIVDGQKAQENKAVCATIADPVRSDARIKLGAELTANDQVIVNVFPSDKEANKSENAEATVIMFNGATGTLDKVSSGPLLSSGNYVMNIVAAGTTARVFFHVK